MRYFKVSIDEFEYCIGAKNEEHARYVISNYFAEENDGLVIPIYPVLSSEEDLSRIVVKEISKEEFDKEE